MHLPWSQNAYSASSVCCWIGLIRRSRIEVPRVDYQKLSGDRLREPSECIRARAQTARDIQKPDLLRPTLYSLITVPQMI